MMVEFSAQVLTGLEALGSSAALREDDFKPILSLSLATALEPHSGELEAPVSGEGVCKEAVFALSTALLELARTDADTNTLTALLEDAKMEPSRAKAVTAIFVENKDKLRAALERLSSELTPNLVDANWRLDYHIKNNHTEKVNRAEYLIQLNTEKSGTASTNLQFGCTQEQLQDLVMSLKDATKSLGRIAQQN